MLIIISTLGPNVILWIVVSAVQVDHNIIFCDRLSFIILFFQINKNTGRKKQIGSTNAYRFYLQNFGKLEK
jgi:hypothetical protein